MNFIKYYYIPFGLVLFSVVPVLAGLFRIGTIIQGGPITVENERFFIEGMSVILHISVASIFSIFGAFQFSTRIRERYVRWHRLSGRVMVLAGVMAAVTGLYLTIVFPKLETDGPTLYYVRLVVGLTMLASLVLAVRAVLARNFNSHGAWMTRAYALGLGAGTQVFTHLPWLLMDGSLPTGLIRDFAMASGWLINYLVAEWIIKRK